MSLTVFLAKKIVLEDETVLEEAALVVEKGRLSWIGLASDEKIKTLLLDSAVQVVDYKENILVPGFIDMHTHGGMGVDFIYPSDEKVNKVAKCYASEGVTSFCTSTMVIHPDLEKEFLEKLGNLAPTTYARNLRIHLEGPHMNVKYHSLMDKRYLRDPDIEEMKENLRITNNRIKMITMAPELEGSQEFIEFCKEQGIVVMLGHSNATTQEALDALKWGASGFTHLYNAMSPHVHRNPGMVTAALMSDGYSELIVDGYHIDPKVVKLTYDIIGSDHLMLITDSMPGKKMGDGDVIFGGLPCKVKNNKAYVIESGRIAGSMIGMDDNFRNIIEYTGCTLVDAVKMSSHNIAKCLKVDDITGSIAIGKFADFVILDDEYQVIDTYLEGKCTTRSHNEQ